MTAMHFFFFNLCEVYQSALHFFERYACVPASSLVGLDTRFGPVQQLLRS
jgi:hypothetical protein